MRAQPYEQIATPVMIPLVISRYSHPHIQKLAQSPLGQLASHSRFTTPRSFSNSNSTSTSNSRTSIPRRESTTCSNKPLGKQTASQTSAYRTINTASMDSPAPQQNGATPPPTKVFFFDIDNCLYPKSEHTSLDN
ncbi:hypothetical protein B0T16DRAFT_416082 [Cercophora newfieldiana]|uniref:Uncharacterized protein n=1 Tax=Cercophora newfieldiana TaxID=92897 RepID=A0AA39Y172_9PEZI|nr:hypothetical protein B0T16DRAFT_416082 [Cercophora newfieldiana]